MTIHQDRQDLRAQWSFDTRPILGRFHLWLEDVQVAWTRGEPAREFVHEMSFLNGRMERLFAMTGAPAPSRTALLIFMSIPSTAAMASSLRRSFSSLPKRRD